MHCLSYISAPLRAGQALGPFIINSRRSIGFGCGLSIDCAKAPGGRAACQSPASAADVIATARRADHDGNPLYPAPVLMDAK